MPTRVSWHELAWTNNPCHEWFTEHEDFAASNSKQEG